MRLQIFVRAALSVIDQDHPGYLIVSVLLDLALDPDRDRVPVGLRERMLLLELLRVEGAHRYDGSMEGVCREVRSALGAVAPERAPGHQAPDVKQLLSTQYLVERDHLLAGGGRHERHARGRTRVCPRPEGHEPG